LEAFIGPRPEGMEARHLDGCKTNNKLENLCWGTREDNEADNVKHGAIHMGSKICQSKLKESDIPVIRELLASGIPKAEIGRRYNVKSFPIYQIACGKTWRHVR
jgi:hypothetical protein